MHGNIHSIPFSYRKSFIIQAVLGVCVLGFISFDSALAQSSKTPANSSNTIRTTGQPLSKPVLKAGSQGGAVTELQAMLKLLSFYSGPVNGVFDESTGTAVAKFQKAANLSPDGIVGADTWNRLLPPSPPVAAANPTPVSTSGQPSTGDTFPIPGNATPNTSIPVAKPTPPVKNTAATGATSMGSDRTPANSQDAAFPILRIGMKGPAVEGLQERLRALGLLKGSADGVFGAETQAAVKAAQRRFSLEPDGVVGNATWMGLLR